MKKTSVFIDGYNLYHAIDNLKKPHLKWVNLFNLSQEFAKPSNGFELIKVKFFTDLENNILPNKFVIYNEEVVVIPDEYRIK